MRFFIDNIRHYVYNDVVVIKQKYYEDKGDVVL